MTIEQWGCFISLKPTEGFFRAQWRNNDGVSAEAGLTVKLQVFQYAWMIDTHTQIC